MRASRRRPVIYRVSRTRAVQAVRNDKEAASNKTIDECKNKPPPERRCPLERVARELADYFSVEFLDEMIASHWRQVVLASGGPGGPVLESRFDGPDSESAARGAKLGFRGLAQGLRELSYMPPVLFRRRHWDDLVVRGGLCDEEGLMDQGGFGRLVKQAVWRFQLSELSLAMDVGECKEWDHRSVRAAFVCLKGALTVEYEGGMHEEALSLAAIAADAAGEPGALQCRAGPGPDLQDLVDGVGGLCRGLEDLEQELVEVRAAAGKDTAPPAPAAAAAAAWHTGFPRLPGLPGLLPGALGPPVQPRKLSSVGGAGSGRGTVADTSGGATPRPPSAERRRVDSEEPPAPPDSSLPVSRRKKVSDGRAQVSGRSLRWAAACGAAGTADDGRASLPRPPRLG